MPNTFQCILNGSTMHQSVTYFSINHYQLGVAHSNEVSEEAQRSNIGGKVIKRSKRSKNLIVRNSYPNTNQKEFW